MHTKYQQLSNRSYVELWSNTLYIIIGVVLSVSKLRHFLIVSINRQRWSITWIGLSAGYPTKKPWFLDQITRKLNSIDGTSGMFILKTWKIRCNSFKISKYFVGRRRCTHWGNPKKDIWSTEWSIFVLKEMNKDIHSVYQRFFF